MGVNVSELSGACEMQARAASRCRVGCAEPELVECDLFISVCSADPARAREK